MEKKKKCSVLLLVMLLHGAMYAQEPYFELRDLDNELKTYSELKGEHLTVIDFWATWCQPCLRSIPELNAIYNEFATRGVSFIGISIDSPRNQSKLKPFVQSMGVDYPILRDVNSEIMSEMNVFSIPALLIITPQGEVVFFHEGYRPGDEELIRKKIEENL